MRRSRLSLGLQRIGHAEVATFFRTVEAARLL
jgi:hypothetical protein